MKRLLATTTAIVVGAFTSGCTVTPAQAINIALTGLLDRDRHGRLQPLASPTPASSTGGWRAPTLETTTHDATMPANYPTDRLGRHPKGADHGWMHGKLPDRYAVRYPEPDSRRAGGERHPVRRRTEQYQR